MCVFDAPAPSDNIPFQMFQKLIPGSWDNDPANWGTQAFTASRALRTANRFNAQAPQKKPDDDWDYGITLREMTYEQVNMVSSIPYQVAQPPSAAAFGSPANASGFNLQMLQMPVIQSAGFGTGAVVNAIKPLKPMLGVGEMNARYALPSFWSSIAESGAIVEDSGPLWFLIIRRDWWTKLPHKPR